ncbi:MAG: S1/P1 Nuclease [Bacteroidetes bacterium]|nr:MAG: S1/P1 Nuclease [Bacteroidota bacterium]MBL1145255.1 S1/P1 Nuclease [Bacteroidota bacterium]NOG58051.1 S1/P1 Nuclease [Bacteroidota bacterium]
MAVFTLPPKMIGFYKENIEYITAHAVDPDKRRYASKNEAPRHYIDIDHYAKSGENPFDSVPRYWNDAVEKYSEDTLMAYGIVPWHVSKMTYYLTKAFKENDANNILRLSADLGHYIADAHVPLHTTKNYNGQLTNQKGIHGLWESRIPEITADNFDYLVGRAEYIKYPIHRIWDAVEESHSYLDSVFFIEKDITEKMSSDQKYAFEQRGNSMVKQYSQAFALAYDARMGDMVESRMRKAISMIGSLWFTAWVDAGQPNLDNLGKKVDLNKMQEEDKQLEEEIKDQKIKGREHD